MSDIDSLSDTNINDHEEKDGIEIVEDDQDVVQDQDLQETEEVQRDGGLEEGDTDNKDEDGDKKKVKPKKIVRNPQPKLNEETLKGPRGLVAIQSYFDQKKFKGKNFEHLDLKTIMKSYEYWCHRLFPKFPFDSCIERLEKLGAKRATQTHIKRIRFDLLLEDKPILSDSDEETNLRGFDDVQSDPNTAQDDQFNQLLESSSAPVAETVPELSKEQLEKIKLNKERAEQLRRERLRKIQEKITDKLETCSQILGTSGIHNNDLADNLETSSQIPGTSGIHNDLAVRDECISATQSTDFSQSSSDNFQNLNDHNDVEENFDHESTVKGKMKVLGTSIIKHSRSIPADEDSYDKMTVISKEQSTLKTMDMDPTDNVNVSGGSFFNSVNARKRKNRNPLSDSDDSEYEINTNQDKSNESNVKKCNLMDQEEENQIQSQRTSPINQNTSDLNDLCDSTKSNKDSKFKDIDCYEKENTNSSSMISTEVEKGEGSLDTVLTDFKQNIDCQKDVSSVQTSKNGDNGNSSANKENTSMEIVP